MSSGAAVIVPLSFSPATFGRGGHMRLGSLSLSPYGAREALEALLLQQPSGRGTPPAAGACRGLLRYFRIELCNSLTSLESRSGELPSLEYLLLYNCDALSSLPDGPRAYSSLKSFLMYGCPGVKTLPTSLQQRLGSLHEEDMDAPYYGNKPRPMLLKPNTWKYAIRKD